MFFFNLKYYSSYLTLSPLLVAGLGFSIILNLTSQELLIDCLILTKEYLENVKLKKRPLRPKQNYHKLQKKEANAGKVNNFKSDIHLVYKPFNIYRTLQFLQKDLNNSKYINSVKFYLLNQFFSVQPSCLYYLKGYRD
ncbi:hypothetical protein BpHYR1_052865 [Brachionus plicatilis]|uniref:Uncharacterized protein n=1 Tax=Brachionus plicatilis TaxID=10195 RepID=A0A3M7RIP3_BRAPC|nr:hypothetical protein BpHYR1_052865 [Brachionus plicatilis]